jgi:hypothetical protein
MLGEGPGAPGVALSLRRPGNDELGAREAEAVHLADDGVAGHPDLGGNPAARKPGTDAALELFDALGSPSR